MFEYLMPLLLMRSYPGDAARRRPAGWRVRRQIEYGAAARRAVGHLRVGVQRRSTATATTSTRPSACPGLGLKRGLGDELVVAPYATALAAWSTRARRCATSRLAARGLDGRLRLLRGDRLHAALGPDDAAGRRRPAGGATASSCARSWRTTRA